MNNNIEFVKWFNTISKCDEKYLFMDIAILDFGFTDHNWVKGLVAIKKNLTIDEFKRLANEVFFESFRGSIPVNVRTNTDIEPEPDIGSIICLIDNKKYTAQYKYSNKELLFIDESSTILNPEDMCKEINRI